MVLASLVLLCDVSRRRGCIPRRKWLLLLLSALMNLNKGEMKAYRSLRQVDNWFGGGLRNEGRCLRGFKFLDLMLSKAVSLKTTIKVMEELTLISGPAEIFVT